MSMFISRNDGSLFSSHGLYQLLQELRGRMEAEIASLDANRMLNTASADLVNYLVEKYRLETPALQLDKQSIQECECLVDVSHDPSRMFWQGQGRRGPPHIPGQRIELEIPFTGQPDLFRYQPSTHSSLLPHGQVRDNSLILTWEIPYDVNRDLGSEIATLTGQIEQHLGWMRSDVETYNNSLPNAAATAIKTRRSRILANQQRVSALKIPVKPRTDAPSAYALPVRRKAAPALPPATSTPYEPEPVWEMGHYEHALKVIQDIAVSMERSPSAFASMKEEHIRDHLLIALNGHFEGAAAGETFNKSGKTDILLRERNRNVFIAECKFWRGSSEFNKAIDQLLGYTAWRDTKTAILVFCRDVEMSTALAGMKSTAEAHPNYKRRVDWPHESGFRYIFHHPDDKNREFTLSLLAFHVPK